MKICFVNQDMSLGGSGTIVHDIIKKWPNKNDNLFLVVFFNIFADRYKDLYNLSNLKIIILDKKKTVDLPFLCRLKNIIKNINPDVISSHLTTTFYLKIVGVTKLCRIFHTIHSEPANDLPRIYRFFLSRDIKKGRIKLIGCCDYISEKAKYVYGVPCLTISNGINCEATCSKKASLIRFLFVGRLCDVKNAIEIVDSFRRVKGNFVFRIVGYGTKEYEQKIKESILSSPNKDRIEFLGKQEDVSDWYINSDILILTSKREGLPVTVLEGIKYGLGFIVNNVGGIKDYVKDGENGIFLKNNNLAFLSSAISFFIENPDVVYRYKKESAKKRSLCSAELMSSKYCEVLRDE